MIGIIGAMEVEIAGILEGMTEVITEEAAGQQFHQGKIAGQEVVVTYCSPGKVNAALSAQTLLLKYQPTLVINPGVAGGIGKGVCIGDLVVGTYCVQHDFDTTPLGEPLGEISTKRGAVVQFPCDATYHKMVLDLAPPIYPGTVHAGPIATGDQFVSDPAKCHWIRETFGAVACEMESGSIAQVCYLNQVPFLALRSISDNADEKGFVDFPTFVKESAQKLTTLLGTLCPLL